MNEQFLSVNGVELCFETFGNRNHLPVLLIAGATNSMDWWETEFCQLLASGGRFVVRYDFRDTGRSTTSEVGAPDYSFEDLVIDAALLIKALELEAVHVVGISLGGGIAQRLAIEHPSIVASLTIVSSSPGIRPGSPPSFPLPPPAPAIMESFSLLSSPPDWSDHAALVDLIVKSRMLFSGSVNSGAECYQEIAEQVVERSNNVVASLVNHNLIAPGGSYGERLGEIVAPTLVVHGSEDPLFPLAHGEKLKAEIPGASFAVIGGVGHQMPPESTWKTVIPLILSHTLGNVGEESK